MRNHLICAAAIMIAAFFFGAFNASSLSVRRLTIDQLAAQSPVIVVGTVMGIEYAALKGAGIPYTKYKLLAQEVVAGDEVGNVKPGSAFTLLFAGGLNEKGEYTVVSGLPMLRLGQTYLMMLRGGEWSISPVAGSMQGAFRIEGLPNGQKLVLGLNDAVLTGLSGGYPQFWPLARASTGPQPAGAATLKLDARTAAPQGGAALYREDNGSALGDNDEKRAAAANKGAKSDALLDFKSRLGGRSPIYYKEFVAELQRAHAAQKAAHGALNFSWSPKPLTGTYSPNVPNVQP